MGKFWLMFKKHYKLGISALFKKQKKKNKMTIFKVNNWAKLKSIIGPSWGSKKKAQLGPIIDFENLRALFFIYKKCAETPYFYRFFLHNLF